MGDITNAKMATFKALSQRADFYARKAALNNMQRNRDIKRGELVGPLYETDRIKILEGNGIRNETDKYNKIFKENVAYNKDFEEKLHKAKGAISIATDRNKWASGALGLGAAAALGGYYVANRDKRWKDKDGKIDKTKVAKDLGKVGLAGTGAWLAGRALETSIMNNSNKKLANFYNSKRLTASGQELYDGFNKIYKNHSRNLALGFGGLALAGVGGYALHRYLKKKRNESKSKESENR